MKKTITIAGTCLVVFFLLIMFSCSWYRIGPGHAGIVVNQAGSDRGVSSQTARTGWFFINPFTETLIEYQTSQRMEKWTKSENEGKPGNTEVSFTNKDSMVIFADVAVAFSLDASKVPSFYVKFLAKDEDDLDVKFTNGYLRNQVRNCLNELAGQYDIKQIMGDNAEFLNRSKKCVQDDVVQWGVNIDQFGLIGAPRPPENVVTSINNKAQAEQDAQRKVIELQQFQADANKKVVEADGDAKAQIRRAEGAAEANRILNASITDNILKMRSMDNQHDAIWRWNQQMPTTLILGGSDKQMLFNVPVGK
jgi:regulator of protease activity HflC (stomatin/prohibitin superfamily)